MPPSSTVLLPELSDDPTLPSPPALAEVLGQLSCVVFRRDMLADGTIRYPWFSANVRDLFGLAAEEITVSARGSLNLVHWADRDGHLAAIRASATALARCHEEFRVVTASGETRWVRGASVPRRLGDGQVAWDGVWMDITPWMRAQYQHQTLMDHAEDCILTIDAAEGIDWVNAATERLFGYELGELSGRCLADLTAAPCPKGNCSRHGCPIQDLVQCYPHGSQEVMARRRDGATFPFEMTVNEVRSDGRLSLIVIGRDITRRKATEMILEETERRLRSIASNLPGVVFQRVRNAVGALAYPYVSDGIRDILGHSPHQYGLDASLLTEAMVAEDRERLMAALTRSAVTLEPVREDVRVRGTDGRVRWLRGQSRPRRRGATIVWDGLLLDVTEEVEERRKAEAALRESEERFRLAFAAASLGIVVVSLDGAIQHFNPAFQALAGRDGADLKGTCFHAFVARDHLPAPESLPAPGESFCVLCEPQLPDGRERHWRLTGTQFAASPTAASPSLLFFIEDVTEITRTAEERRQLELALQEGQKLEALGRLAGGVAHELNNMLGPILMGAEMVARTAPLDERNAERIGRIIDAAKTGRDIVRNVLAYCRKEQKALATVDIVPVLDQFASLVASIMPPSVKVERRIGASRAVVKGDAGQMHQIFLNLANNARDAMDGRGTLSMSLEMVPAGGIKAMPPRPGKRPPHPGETRPEDGRANPLAVLDPSLAHVDIRFSDTGCGMTPTTIAKIFDPFYTTKPVGQGTGLGLSVVQGIIKAMGGAIAVESEPGAGTTFRILLPLAQDNPE